MTYDEFYHDYMQGIYARSEAEQNYTEVQFTEKICDFLVDQAIIENYSVVSYKKSSMGVRLDAYNYSSDSGALTMIVTDYRSSPQTLNQSEITKIFKRTIKFFQKSLDMRFYQSLDESDQGFTPAREINVYSGNIRKIQFILISSALLSKRVDSLPSQKINEYSCHFDIWDLGRIQRLEESGKSREDIVVDFTTIASEGIPCLPASTGNDNYESYLLVIPGSQVAELYDEYGERLLEQNVRTFLQFRGKVNKGMRNTIQNEPEMFFAFNNGITATAEEVVTITDEKQVKIKEIRNLQIVNGGQTTASLFNARRNNKADLSDVYVQVKLTVIPEDKTEEIVPRISEYANTQNKVSAADFFSNHPFHLRVEEISRRLWAPSSEGSLRETHWYYERVRGQYANAQSNFTPAQKREFTAQNPRYQMFTKTDLAKFLGSWNRIPHTVSLGAQKNFVLFANDVAKDWDKNEKQYNELYFKELMAKAIIFRFLDKTLMKQPWYGGYKANIVTYSVAKFSELIQATGKYFDLELVWKNQGLSLSVQNTLHEIAEIVNEHIQDTPIHITNVTEWCKKKECWDDILSFDYSLSKAVLSELQDLSVKSNKKKDAVKIRTIDNGIEAQTYVCNKGAEYWKKILDWDDFSQVLTPNERGIIRAASLIPNKIPTEKQSLRSVELEQKAVEEGFFLGPHSH